MMTERDPTISLETKHLDNHNRRVKKIVKIYGPRWSRLYYRPANGPQGVISESLQRQKFGLDFALAAAVNMEAMGRHLSKKKVIKRYILQI